MKILNARLCEYGSLIVDVDKVPDMDNLVWNKAQSGMYTFYLATTCEGYATYLCSDPDNKTGFDGHQFDLKMSDGTIETVVGPWSSRPGLINQLFDQQIVDVTYMPHHIAGAITLDKAAALFKDHGKFIKFESGYYDLVPL